MKTQRIFTSRAELDAEVAQIRKEIQMINDGHPDVDVSGEIMFLMKRGNEVRLFSYTVNSTEGEEEP